MKWCTCFTAIVARPTVPVIVRILEATLANALAILTVGILPTERLALGTAHCGVHCRKHEP